MIGDLYGKDCRVCTLVEPAFFLDGDTGSVGKSDMHAPDRAAGLTQEPHNGIVAGPQLCATYNYHRADHV